MPDYTGEIIGVIRACDLLGITTPTFYAWRKRDPDFPKEVAPARYLDLDILEYQAKRAKRELEKTRARFQRNREA